MDILESITEHETTFEHLGEECGVVGIAASKRENVAALAYYALYALQHRGQQSAGIAVNDDGVISAHCDEGLVNEVFDGNSLAKLGTGSMAVGHVRYSTTGYEKRINCQPLVVNHIKGTMAIAHNGNLVNDAELREELELAGSIFHTTTDTEVIAYTITKERLTADSIEEAVSRAMDRIKGAYSLVIMSPKKLIAARDPHGFRPLCIGELSEGGYCFASETCALDAMGAKFLRDVEPGEIVVVENDELRSLRSHCGKVKPALCVFEYIYFARPDSVIDGCSVHLARQRAGSFLALEHPVQADVVIGVPDSGLDAAIGFSRQSGIPYGIGFIKTNISAEPSFSRNRTSVKSSFGSSSTPYPQRSAASALCLSMIPSFAEQQSSVSSAFCVKRVQRRCMCVPPRRNSCSPAISARMFPRGRS